MQTVRSFAEMDVYKEIISISVAEAGRNGPVRFIGIIANLPDDIARGKKPAVVVTALARKLAGSIWAIGQEMRTPMTT